MIAVDNAARESHYEMADSGLSVPGSGRERVGDKPGAGSDL